MVLELGVENERFGAADLAIDAFRAPPFDKDGRHRAELPLACTSLVLYQSELVIAR